MTIEKKLLGTSPSGGATDVADVFSTHLFTGNNVQNVINNGIDLAGEGGLVWLKPRSGNDHALFDTNRGIKKSIFTNSTGAQETAPAAYPRDLTNFNSNGFTLNQGYHTGANTNNVSSVSWTFRKKEKFFDVVTYAGNETSGRLINHSLGSVPAMIIVKQLTSASNWPVFHKDLGGSKYLDLNTSAASTNNNTRWAGNLGGHTDTQFRVGLTNVNKSGQNYVAYLFADNSSEDADDQMIKCGSYTGNGNANGPVVNLGWEPQFLLIKNTSYSHDWVMLDVMRGVVTTGDDAFLRPNTTGAEDSDGGMELNATGFKIADSSGILNENNNTFIYMAIRAPMMKKPSAATDVFAVDAAGSGAIPAWESGFPVDFALYRNVSSSVGTGAGTRMLGTGELFTNNNAAIAASGAVEWDYSNGFYTNNSRSASYYSWMWKRAKGYFDVVAYSGTGSPRTLAHSLGVVPEMIVCKSRSTTGGWQTYHKTTGNTKYLYWNQNYPAQTSSSVWNNTTPTDSVFTVGNGGELNGNNIRYVAYLFATLAGISKVGSYTGTGSDINVDCGFSAGARFILIKRTDATGEDWIYYDTVRGIVAGVDPFLKLNETNQQNAGNDGVDPLSSGFTVTSSSSNNTSGGTYIFYAIA